MGHEHKTVKALYYCECGAIKQGKEGQWTTDKDPAAVALAMKAVAVTTPEERKAHAAKGGMTRWSGYTPEDRKKFMSWMASQPRPRPRKGVERCECGRFTKNAAEKRRHYCGTGLEEAMERWRAMKPEIAEKYGRTA